MVVIPCSATTLAKVAHGLADTLLTRAAYALSSPERLVSKSEVVRLAIAKIVEELEGNKEELAELLKRLEPEEE
jgi:phosphopantothenoylcysteine synthetase/decarboxylase